MISRCPRRALERIPATENELTQSAEIPDTPEPTMAILIVKRRVSRIWGETVDKGDDPSVEDRA